jgi:hypothetical protein
MSYAEYKHTTKIFVITVLGLQLSLGLFLLTISLLQYAICSEQMRPTCAPMYSAFHELTLQAFSLFCIGFVVLIPLVTLLMWCIVGASLKRAMCRILVKQEKIKKRLP